MRNWQIIFDFDFFSQILRIKVEMTLEVSSVLPSNFHNLNLNIIEGVRVDRIIILFEIFPKNCLSVTALQLTTLCFNIISFSSKICFYLFAD